MCELTGGSSPSGGQTRQNKVEYAPLETTHICSVQVSLDQYHTEEEIYQMSLQREPRKQAVSIAPVGPALGGGALLPAAASI